MKSADFPPVCGMPFMHASHPFFTEPHSYVKSNLVKTCFLHQSFASAVNAHLFFIVLIVKFKNVKICYLFFYLSTSHCTCKVCSSLTTLRETHRWVVPHPIQPKMSVNHLHSFQIWHLTNPSEMILCVTRAVCRRKKMLCVHKVLKQCSVKDKCVRS